MYNDRQIEELNTIKTEVMKMWRYGRIGKYDFAAKVYDIPSDSGINQGRVSKLTIKKGSRIVASYDRGWDKKPLRMKVVKMILAAFA